MSLSRTDPGGLAQPRGESHVSPCHGLPRSLRFLATGSPKAPDPFRFARRRVLAGLLDQAGAEEVTERLLKFFIEAPVSLDQFWTIGSEMSEMLRDKVAEVAPKQLVQVARA